MQLLLSWFAAILILIKILEFNFLCRPATPFYAPSLCSSSLKNVVVSLTTSFPFIVTPQLVISCWKPLCCVLSCFSHPSLPNVFSSSTVTAFFFFFCSEPHLQYVSEAALPALLSSPSLIFILKSVAGIWWNNLHPCRGKHPMSRSQYSTHKNKNKHTPSPVFQKTDIEMITRWRNMSVSVEMGLSDAARRWRFAMEQAENYVLEWQEHCFHTSAKIYEKRLLDKSGTMSNRRMERCMCSLFQATDESSYSGNEHKFYNSNSTKTILILCIKSK